MKRDELQSAKKAKLIELATEKAIAGRHSMTKAELIEALAIKAPPVSTSKPVLAKNTGDKEGQPSATDSKPTGEKLRKQTKKQLVQLAGQKKIASTKDMKKEDLIQALTQHRESAKGNSGKSRRKEGATPVHAANRRTTVPTNSVEEQVVRSKYPGSATQDLSRSTPKDLPADYGRDRIVAMVRDPYWLHVYWELTRKSVERTAAALGQHWYTAKPMLRVLTITSDDTSHSSETVLRDIEIHGGVNNWYVDVQNPPGTYRVDVGYLTTKGRYYVLARSNVVTTPRPGMSDEIDTHWPTVRDECERIYAMSGGADPGINSTELRKLFEERLRRPMSSGVLTDFGSGALGEENRSGFHFEIDAELIVYGRTERNAKVTLQGEPLQLRQDGTFTVRFGLPDGRQIIPAVAQSPDGIEDRTIILAIERNTKELEPMIHDGNE